MFDHIITKVLLGWVRHLISGFGGSLVAQGLLTQDQSNQAVGAVMILVPLMFSAYDKFQAKQAADQAILSHTLKGQV